MRARGALILLSLLAGGCPQSPKGTPSPAASAATPSPGPSGVASPAATQVEAPRATPQASASSPPSSATRSSETPAASPSPTPASSKGLAGIWIGRRISLELTSAGSGYRGTLTLGKRSLEIEVERGPQGWGGVLVQGERKAEFSLTRREGGLVLSADGRSYTLERVEVRASIVGNYLGPRGTSLVLNSGVEGYTGTLTLEGVEYVLRGQEAEGNYHGSLRDPLTGKELTWRASEVDEDTLLFTIRLEEQDAEGRASFHALRFERSKE